MALTLRTGVLTAEVDDGIALLDEDAGQYWDLNPTGALVLQTLLDGGTPEQAARALAAEFAVEPGEAARDVRELVDELHAAGLLEGTTG